MSPEGPTTHVEPPGGKARVVLQLREEERRERRLRGRLEHDGAACGKRRCDLVGHEVEREVERADRADDADRKPHGERELSLACLRRVHRDDLARELSRLHGRHRVRGHRPRDLDPCRLERLPGLGRDLPRGLVGSPAERARDTHEDLCPLVRRERVAHRPLGGVDGRSGLRRAGLRDARDDRPVVRRHDVEPRSGLEPPPVEQQLSLRRRRCHGTHSTPAARCYGHPMTDALIVDAVRTPIGRRNGALAGVRADELAAQVLNGLVGRLDLEPGEIEDVQMGCVSQVGEQALNVARMSSLVAGWPETVCGTSVDRQCGSSMQAAFNAAAAIQAGHLDVVVASGVESMSRVPMGSNLTAGGFEGFSPKLYERWEVVSQGISAEVIADEWDLSREDLDAYSYESHRRAISAIDDGRFEREIVPVEVGAGGAAVLVGVDENPRRDTSPEKLAELKPAFKEDGKVTAGNSSAIVDGAAAMLVASEAAASRVGLEPRGRFVSFGIAGVDPYRMLHGNPPACERALAKARLTWDDIAVIEVNEAFASVVLQFLKDTGLHERWEAGDVNPNGSGISLGHPLGATGARITATLLAELERREARYGVASMCIGQGQAIAAVVERL